MPLPRPLWRREITSSETTNSLQSSQLWWENHGSDLSSPPLTYLPGHKWGYGVIHAGRSKQPRDFLSMHQCGRKTIMGVNEESVGDSSITSNSISKTQGSKGRQLFWKSNNHLIHFSSTLNVPISSVLYNCWWNIFWTVDRTKQVIWRRHLELWETERDIL